MLNGTSRGGPFPLRRRLASLNGSPVIRNIAAGILALLTFVCIAELVDTYYLYAFEADAAGTLALTQAFAEVAVTRWLPAPGITPPYFDGPYWIYAAGYLVTKGAVALGLFNETRLPSNQSIALFAIRHVNLLAQVGSVILVFVTATKLNRGTLLALLLSLVFIMDPQLLAIDLLRIDRVILFLFILVFSISLEVNRGRQDLRLDFALGVITAALVMTKITSVVFLIIPAFAYLHQRVRLKAPPRHAFGFLASFMIASALIDIRYLVYGWRDFGFLPQNLLGKLAAVASWSALASREPYLYYNWDVFLPLGEMFLVLFIVALACCVWGLVRHRDADAGLILLPLLVLSLLGLPAMKYPRAGYVLMPLYLYVVACGTRILRNALAHVPSPTPKRHWIASAALSVALLFPLYNAWKAYQQARLEASGRDESINLTRIAPREWFMTHVPPKTRVAIFIDSDWADPPIFDLGYDFSPTVLRFPYLDATQIGRFFPPRLDALPQITDVIVLNNFHRGLFPAWMRRLGQEELASGWERFFDALPQRYPHLQFKAAHPNYQVDQVDVIIVNPASLAR